MSRPFDVPAPAPVVDATAAALREHGFTVEVVENGAAARAAVLARLTDGAEIFTATSRTLETIGLLPAIEESKRFNLVRPAFMELYKAGKHKERRKLGASPDVIIGSVHAVTESGEVVVASATGSQLGPYASGSESVIWVVGSQKLVEDLPAALDRLEKHALPLEDARMKAAGFPGSVLAKILIVRREFVPGRVTIVLVREALGF